jgi:ribosomal protein S18 acetylase RimI-like enzyme
VLHEHYLDHPRPERRLSLVRREQRTYRLLSMDDALAFQALRLEALEHHPESFVPTFDEERAVDPAAIVARFRDWTGGDSFILGAFAFGWLVGAVAVRGWPRRKYRHKATLWMLYTRSGVRGQGIGRELLERAVAECRRTPHIEQLYLTVGTDSDAARRLYTSTGFRPYGIERQAMKLDDRYVDVELMALPVAR